MKRKKAAACLFFALFTAGSLWFAGRLLTPKYMGDIVEGALTAEYYREETPHDVIFIGDCEVYENISPITLWEDYGITSYIRGSAQQLIWQSYYLLEDTLRYEKPKAVVFNVLALKYDEPQKEAYNRMTLDGMRWGMPKVNAIRASMMEDEHFIEYVFPLLRYHSRWSELTEDDFKYLFHRDRVSHSGYYMRADVKPAGTFPKPKKLGNYQFGENAVKYLDMMTELCEENGIELVLIKAPSLYPAWYEQWEEQVAAYAEEHGLLYLNYLELADEAGIDFSTDTYDGGLHLNLSGAEKLAAHLGRMLKEECGLSDHRSDPEIAADWEKKREFYYAMKERQERELAEYGYLKMYNSDEE